MRIGREIRMEVIPVSLLKDKKGFSLVEMIIVMAVMAILIGGMVSYMGYINNGKTKKSIASFTTKLDRVQTDNMAKEGDTYLYLYKTSDGVYCKIVNVNQCTGAGGVPTYPDGFTQRSELDSFLTSNPDATVLSGKKVDVKAEGVTATGGSTSMKLDNTNMIKIGFDKVTGAYKCSNNGSSTDFYNLIKFEGLQHYSVKLVKSTGKHIEE